VPFLAIWLLRLRVCGGVVFLFPCKVGLEGFTGAFLLSAELPITISKAGRKWAVLVFVLPFAWILFNGSRLGDVADF
jgi:hypothetical protein